ncbi:uncharacterized protein EV422DRAFT_56725 [Fimicolochytrium jonesii]|uniref:uncharacterized protein n=1 Tax=Fimicolochytrium jonesii TaxID=1396493 RepID=UPI0022FDB2BE|nr:uncharacterized protein EV422DRAFT_56725 [Fimicolochytrium jonesii]KAI8821172.1 hypothetical protein EV422DRAFT_56725 [Fimicolochytrium jonesii]
MLSYWKSFLDVNREEVAPQSDAYLRNFDGMPAPAALPLPAPAPAPAAHGQTEAAAAAAAAASVPFEMPAELAMRAVHFANQHNCTLEAVVYSAWAIVQSRYLNAPDVVFGADIIANTISATTAAAQPFAPRPVRIQLMETPAGRVSTLFRALDDAMAASKASSASLEDIRAAAGISASDALFRVAVGFWTSRDAVATHLDNAGLSIIVRFGKPAVAATPAAAAALPVIPAEIIYSPAVYDDVSMKALAGHLLQALTGMLPTDGSDPVVANVNILTRQESRMILRDFNDNEPEVFENELLPRGRWCVQIPFEKKAEQFFDKVAAEHYDTAITYGELNAHANRIAHALRQLGVGPGQSVGMLVDRGVELVVAFWGIVKSSAAYVPMDSSFPGDRLQYMMRDADCVALVTTLVDDARIAAAIPPEMRSIPILKVRDFTHEGNNLAPSENPIMRNTSADLLYVVYTSGTTGKPKGVEIPHRVMYHLVLHTDGGFGNGPATRQMQMSSIGFDNLGWEILATHCRGGTLVVRPDDLGEDWEEALHRINTLLITPSALSVVDPDQYPNITKIITSGEASNAGLVSRWGDRVLMLNGYGPAETHATHMGVNRPGERITVGRVIPGDTCYILDDHLRPVPLGVPGLVWIGGIGVGNGYRNLPDLTSQKFRLDPFAKDGSRMYNTGDVGRFTHDGELEVVGRADHQIKLNGFRVELGEIETVLGGLPGVVNVVVLYEAKQLVGFVTPGHLDVEELCDGMKKLLPYYMVPTKIMALEALPMTVNRKADRRKLSELLASPGAPAMSHRPEPTTSSRPATVHTTPAPQPTSLPTAVNGAQAESTIASIWAAVLKVPVESITPDTSFLAIGGDSISAILVSSRLRKMHGIRLSPTVVFNNPVLKNLAAKTNARTSTSKSTPTQGTASATPLAQPALQESDIVSGPVELTPIQHWFLEWKAMNPNHYNQTFLLIPNQRLIVSKVTKTMNALVAHHDMLRARFTLSPSGGRAVEQRILTADGHPSVITAHLTASDKTEMLDKLNVLQRSLDLSAGPTVAAGLFEMDDGTQRLAITIHHLVMDLVSWRILLEDFQTVYTGVEALPAKTTSFQTWARKQVEYSRSNDLVSLWRNTIPAQPLIRTDFPGKSCPGQLYRANTMRRHTVQLSTATVERLFAHALPFYNCSTLELLVAALALAYGEQFGRNSFSVDLEGHGREAWDEDLDVSRTLGWFTTTFPVSFPASSPTHQEGYSSYVKEVARTIRDLPLKGLPYGVLRYLSDKPSSKAFVASHPTSEIIYNYYGTFNQLEDKDGLFDLAHEEYPNGEDDYDETEMLRYRFSIETIQHAGTLETRFLYSSEDFTEATVDAFAQKWVKYGNMLVDAASSNTCGQPFRTISVAVQQVPLSVVSTPEVKTEPLASPTLSRSGTFDSGYDDETVIAPFDLLCMAPGARPKILEECAAACSVRVDEIKDAVPSTPMQTALIGASVLEPTHYAWQSALKISGDVDPARLERAWRDLIEANDMLRSTFCYTTETVRGTDLLQIVLHTDRSECKRIRCDARQDFDTVVEEYLDSDMARGFRPGEPFVRAALIEKPGQQTSLMVSMQHAIMDQWSLEMIVEDLRQRYNGRAIEPYTSFAHFTRFTMDADWSLSQAFWDDYLGGMERTNYPRSSGSGKLASHNTSVSENKVSLELGVFTSKHGILASALVYAAFGSAVSARVESKDIVFGAVFSGRTAPLDGIERICGPCLNVLPFRTKIVDGTTILDHLRILGNNNSTMMEYESTPKSVVSSAAKMDKLFDFMIALQNVGNHSKDHHDGPGINIALETIAMREDLPFGVEVSLTSNSMEMTFRFDESIISHFEIDLLSRHVAEAMAYMIQHPHRTVETIPAMSTHELKILHSFAQGRHPPTRGVLLHELVQRQASLRPDKIAAEFFRGDKLTYGQLMARANRLAHHLHSLGVRPEMAVGICIPRSLDMLVAALAILIAGGAYLPLSDKTSSVERNQAVIATSQAKWVVTTRNLASHFSGATAQSAVPCVLIDALEADLMVYPSAKGPAVRNLSDRNLAYILFTSGSTGKPKGVLLEHVNVVNSLRAHGLWNIGHRSRVLNVSPINFDLSVADIFLPLTSGGTVVMASEDDIMSDISTVLNEARIDHVEMVPSMAETLNPDNVPELKQLVTAGEMMSEALIKRWAHRVRLIDAYGPTEATIHTHMRVVESGDENANVGLPIGDVATYLLHGDLSMVPIGVPGEVYIDGFQVCRSYINETAREKSAFLPNPYKQGGRLYRTGDMAIYEPDGTLKIVGRRGNETKINGLRINLEAIDTVIMEANVFEAAVTHAVKHNGSHVLVAFIVRRDGASSLRDVIKTLETVMRAKLVSYMVPQHWVPLDAIPLGPNFKLDRRALDVVFSKLDLKANNELTRDAISAKLQPVTQFEKDMQAMWSSLLGLSPSDIGINDSLFALGGDSLALIKLVNNARAKGFPISASQALENPTIAGLAKLFPDESPASHSASQAIVEKERMKVTAAPFAMLSFPHLIRVSSKDLPELGINLEAIEDIYPASPMQQSLVAASLNMDSSYLCQAVYEFTSKPDVSAFKQAWRQVILATPILRTTFVLPEITENDIQCLQVVMRDDIATWQDHHITDMEELEGILSADLAKGVIQGSSFVRFALVHGPAGSLRFIWTIHHALYDGWSMKMTMEDLRLVSTGGALTRRPPFRDFLQHLSTQDQAESRAFWNRELEDFQGMTFPRLPSPGYKPQSTGKLTVPIEVDVEQHARQLGVTVSTLFRAAWALVLGAHSNTYDVSFACISSGRSAPVDGIENMNGPCVTCVPVRIKLDKEMDVKSLLHALQKQYIEMMAFESCSLTEVLKCAPQLSSMSSLFTTMLVIQDARNEAEDTAPFGLKLLKAEMDMDVALCLEVKKSSQGWEAEVDFDIEIIAEGELKWIMDHVHYTLKNLVKSTSLPLRKLALSSPEELAFQVNQWGRRIVEVDTNVCIHHLVEQQVEKAPNKIAVEFLNGTTLTYAELNRRSNLVANYLRSIGVGPEHVIPICLPKCVEMVVAVLGVLKAGGAYVPLDTEVPSDRINFIITQTKSTTVLTLTKLVLDLQSKLTANVIGVDSLLTSKNVNVKNVRVPSLSPKNLAYIIYTSGSTGEPKGAMIEHRAIVSASGGFSERYNHSSRDRRLNYAAFTFDDSVMDIFATLRHGGTICMAPKEDLQTDLAGVIAQMNVTFLATTPSVLELLDPDRIPSMRAMDIGGEPMKADLVKRWGDRIHLGNACGPTETCCLTHSHRHYADETNIHLIGYPFREVIQYLLDDDLQPVPIGCVGEICLAGPQLGRGYLGRPDLTAKAWVDHPQFGRIYRSGDLGRFWHDGQLIIMGRSDDQVKLNGLRIELGEIENVLLRCEEVTHLAAVVMTLAGEKDKSLVCFYDLHQFREKHQESKFLEPDSIVQGVESTLLQLARAALPHYMVPSVLVPMTRMPLNKNGKIDKTSLKKVCVQRTKAAKTQMAEPTTATEAAIFSLVKNLVGNGNFGIDDPWRTIGMNSISMIRLVGLLRSTFHANDLKVTILDFHGNIRQLGAYIDELQGLNKATPPLSCAASLVQRQSVLKPQGGGVFPASFAQERMWLAQETRKDSTYHVPELMRIRRALDPAKLIKAMCLVCERHALFRTTFDFDGDNLTQVVHSTMTYGFESIDLTSSHDPISTIQKLCAKDNAELFDLSDTPAVRFKVFQLGTNDYCVYLNVHHILFDEWTCVLLLNELSSTYGKIMQNDSIQISPPSLEYVDFTVWQRHHVAEVEQEQLQFWSTTLANTVPARFPTWTSGGTEKKSVSRKEEFLLDPAAVDEFLKLCKLQGATPFVGWLSLLQVLVFRYTESADFAILTPLTNRSTASAYTDTLGCFLNTAAICARMDANQAFTDYLQRNARVVMEQMAQTDVPFERIVNSIAGKEARQLLSAFPVMFSHVTNDKYIADGSDIFAGAEDISIGTQESGHYDVTVYLVESRVENEVKISISYNTELYDSPYINALFGHFNELLRSVASLPSTSVGYLRMVNNEEELVLLSSENIESSWNRLETLHTLFEKQYFQSPGSIALEHLDGSTLTYAELNAKANQVAHFLRSEGLPLETAVVLCLDKCFDAVWWMLGASKAGCCWAPVDPAGGTTRNDTIVRAAKAPFVVTTRKYSAAFRSAGHRVIELDALDPTSTMSTAPLKGQQIRSDILSHILFTSGSTGTPKGVMIEQENAWKYAEVMSREFQHSRSTRMLNFSSYTFDVSVIDIFSTLNRGGTVCIAPVEEMHRDLASVIRKLSVNALALTPTVLSLLTPEEVPSVTRICSTGEPITQSVIDTWFSNTELLINAYGPTETAVTTVDRTGPSTSPTVIGRAVGSCICVVVDERMNVVPIGIKGQLAVAGGHVARGYLNREDLTKEKFIDGPAPLNQRLYLTGDLVRKLPDGRFECFGRLDNQIKLNGRRMELGEIEHVLAKASNETRNACVLLHSTHKPSLIGYVTFHDVTGSVGPITDGSKDQQLASIHAYVKKNLPTYMVPRKLIAMKDFPLSLSGKIDRKRVLAMNLPQTGTPQSTKADANTNGINLSQWIRQTLCQILNLEDIRMSDDLARLGFDSYGMMRLVLGARKIHGLDTTVKHLQSCRTVQSLCDMLLTEQMGAVVARKEEKRDLGSEVANLISELLKADDISADDDLTAHGLESYAVMRLIHRIRKTFQVDLMGTEITENPSVRSLTALIDQKLRQDQRQPVAEQHPSSVIALTETQRHLEREVFKILTELLKTDDIDPQDDLSSHGLESYAVMRLIVRVRKAFAIELVVADISEKTSIKSLTAMIKQRMLHGGSECQPDFGSVAPYDARTKPPVPKGEFTIVAGAEYPASYTQERMWAGQVAHGDNAYHLDNLWVTDAHLNCEYLLQAMEIACNRHSIMRTTYRLNASYTELVQFVRDDLAYDFEIIDLSKSSDAVSKIKTYCYQNNMVIYDLAEELPIRFRVFRLANGTGLYLNCHHIAVDEWGLNLFLDEVTKVYEGLVAGKSLTLEPAPQFISIMEKQRERLEANSRQLWTSQSTFWETYLKNFSAVPLHDTLAVTSGTRGIAVWTKPITLKQSTVKSFLKMCAKASASPFAAYLTLFESLIARRTGWNDFGIVTPVSLRNAIPDGFSAVGCFINTVMLRAQLHATNAFMDNLRTTKANVTGVLRNIDVPFETVMTANGITTSDLQLMFDYNTTTGLEATDNLFSCKNSVEYEVPSTAHFPFTLNVDARGGTSGATFVSIQYDSQLFESKFVEEFLQEFAMLLQAVTDSPDQLVTTLEYRKDDQMIVRGPAAPVPFDCIHQGFEQSATTHPDNIAIEFGQRRITYRDLDMQATAVARHLRAHGVQNGVYVAIVVNRSIEMGIALLATLKAGGICTPVSAEYPKDRIKYILETTSPKVTLTTAGAIDALPPLQESICCLLVEDLLLKHPGNMELVDTSTGKTTAYCIFTYVA